MKKLLVLIVIMVCFCSSGCFVKGQGRTVGYVTTIEDTSVIFGWDTVWFRVETGTFSSAQSQPEAYGILHSNMTLQNALMETCRKHQKIELIYDAHIRTVAKSNDIAIGFNVIE